METRWSLQVVLLAALSSSWAQNVQPQLGGFQSQTPGQFSTPQRVSSLTQPSPVRIRPPQTTAQAQGGFAGSQVFQGTPQTPRVRTTTPLRTPVNLALRQKQQLRQFEQPQVSQVPQFEQPQAIRQLEQAPVTVQQYQQQPTAQQVNQQNFEQAQRFQQQQQVQQQQQPVQSFELPQAPPPVVRRPSPPPQEVTPVVRTHQAPVRHHQTQVYQESPTYDEELIREQAENAHYSFTSAVMDGISDQEHLREETRDGLNLKGLYSYSDGYFKRTVHYEADENGYRVIKEEVEPIGDGPQEDPNGRADVSSSIGGNSVQYSVTGADIAYRTAQRTKQAQQQQQQHQQGVQFTSV